MVLNPGELRGREGGDGNGSCSLSQVLSTELSNDVLGLRSGTRVIPQQRWSHHLTGRVQRNKPMLLTTYGDGLDIRGLDLAESIAKSAPPFLGVNFCSLRMRRAR